MISINGKKIEFTKGDRIIEILSRIGIKTPSLCYHPDLKIRSSCRICMVELNGKQVPACSTEAREGMIIKTDTPEIKRARKINLELIFAQHCEECIDCVWFSNCELLRLAKEYGANIKRFSDRKKDLPTFKFGLSLEFDSSKCIDCQNCIQVCENQGVGFIKTRDRGHLREVIPSEDNDCVYCGQCILHCPAGAFEGVGEFESVQQPLAEKGKIVVFQIAPAVRVSIGEEFGLPSGTIVTHELTASLKAIGADYVFDVSSGADFTTIEESKEALQRKDFPILTSCCPSWVKYIESYHPELIPNLATTRSPHIILGGIIKSFWAKKNGIDPQNIFVISVMPCVSKRFEIEREELKFSGMRPVDSVMTVREVARMIKNQNIDLVSIEPLPLDDPFGKPSGSGINYGVSGGVMESALKNIGVKDIRLIETSPGVKEAEINLNGNSIKVATISGLGNAKRIIENGISGYHCIEVMACPGGCIGGGGQPLPSNEDVKEKRRKALRSIGDSIATRDPNLNPAVKDVYDYLNGENGIFHTEYRKR